MTPRNAFALAGKRLARHLPPSLYRLSHTVLNVVLSAWLNRLHNGQTPIIAGPFTTEVGHELLYWIPFLTRLKEARILDPERVVAVSRGGNSSWYAHVACGYYDVFQSVTPVEFRRVITEQRKGRLEKQLVIDRFDRRILDDAASYCGFGEFEVLHPWIMNVLLVSAWRGRLPAERELRYLAFEPFAREEVDLRTTGIELSPDREYVATKFHFNHNFPRTPENIGFINRLVESLAQRYKVLVLQFAEPFDNHSVPIISSRHPNVIDCREIPLNENLRFQTFLIRHAKYFVTTLGGLALLPPFLGRECFAFYSGKYVPTHAEVAAYLFDRLYPGGFHFCNTMTFDVDRLP